MPKRKRDSHSPSTGDRALDIKISRLKVRIEQGVSQLKKALNLARGFERQKLGRRQKAASSEPKELLRLREEVIVLKQLDLEIVAERQLYKRLGKVKRINETPAYVNLCAGKNLEGPKNDAEANVVGRLMNSNPLKECLPGVVDSILDVLGLAKAPEKNNSIGHSSQSVTKTTGRLKSVKINELTRAEDDEWSGAESEAEDGMSLDDPSDPHDGIERDVFNDSENEEFQENVDWGSEFSGFSERIAASSEDESEGGLLDMELPVGRKMKALKQEELEGRLTRQIEISTSLGSPSLSPPESPKFKAKKKSKVKAPSSTAFLPSLMMGGYYSGSESASDIEEERNKARKNRRGQRARQKIAEAKFGAAAKHIAKQNAGQNAGWDPKRGATDGNFNSKGRMKIGRPLNTKGPTGANGDTLGARKKEVVKEGPMHPSWEAARKRKQQVSKISINPAGVGMGKKTTFE